MKNTLVISAYAGIGKSSVSDIYPDLKVLDLDSSNFSKEPSFPDNYIQAIIESYGEVDIILISTHEPLREALLRRGLDFCVVYPDIELKEEYFKRYCNRGDDFTFIKCMMDNWKPWITSIQEDKRIRKFQLGCGRYLSSLIPFLMELHKIGYDPDKNNNITAIASK